jgi:A/G-specific adenine glycosylase
MKLPTNQEIVWFRRRLRGWFRTNARDFPWRQESASFYMRILSEVLLQRTRAQVAADFIPAFIQRYPSWAAISRTSSKELQKHLKPIGLWRRRAASLARLAHEMTKRNGVFPTTRSELEQLPNVGQYIANAVLLFCYQKQQPLLDVNMARVLERFFGPRKLADIRYDPYLQTIARKVVSGTDPIRVNWAILDHAATVCKISNPMCDRCPVTNRCKFANALKRKLQEKRKHLVANTG